jgi:hypothetical protein
MRAAIAFVAFLVPLMLAEALLRTCLPYSRVLDRFTDAYWIALLQERKQEVGDDGEMYGDIELDQVLGWRPRANQRGTMQSTNSKGLRGVAEYEYARSRTIPRIVALGDSFTFGFGVRDSEVFTSLLATRLAPAEVLNLGVNGFGIDQQFLYWVTSGKNYRPDLVLLTIYAEDFHRNTLSVRELPKPRFELRGERLVLVPPLRLEDVLATRAGEPGASPRVALLLKRAWSHMFGRPEGELAVKRRLLEMILAKFASSMEGSNLVVVFAPYPNNTWRDEDFVRAALSQESLRLGIPFLDLTEAVRRGKDGGAYGRNDHWNEMGQELAAREIERFLILRALWPPPISTVREREIVMQRETGEVGP